MPLNPASLLVSILFNSRNQARIFHLQTDSYARHKALNEYYDSVIELADKYSETYQGIFGIIKGYRGQPTFLEGEKHIIPYFEALEKNISSLEDYLPTNLDLENIYSEILGLIHTTIYKLKKLH